MDNVCKLLFVVLLVCMRDLRPRALYLIAYLSPWHKAPQRIISMDQGRLQTRETTFVATTDDFHLVLCNKKGVELRGSSRYHNYCSKPEERKKTGLTSMVPKMKPTWRSYQYPALRREAQETNHTSSEYMDPGGPIGAPNDFCHCNVFTHYILQATFVPQPLRSKRGSMAEPRFASYTSPSSLHTPSMMGKPIDIWNTADMMLIRR